MLLSHLCLWLLCLFGVWHLLARCAHCRLVTLALRCVEATNADW